MRSTFLILVLAIILILLLAIHLRSEEKKDIILEIHDASPIYGIEKVRELIKIGEKYNVSKIYVFLIPKHGNKSLNIEFVENLKKICRKPKCEIGIHGYAHLENEFNVDRKKANELVNLIKDELYKFNLTSRAFLPPMWKISKEALEVVEKNFEIVFLKDRIIFKNYTIKAKEHEYCWYGTNIVLKKKAEFDYMTSSNIFRLSVHVNASNTEECMKFLDEFLSKTCKQKV